MRYTVLFEILPPASFGLPDGSKVVMPAARNVITFEATFGPGGSVRTTPSLYRKEEEAVESPLNLGEVSGYLKDNNLSVIAEANNARDAYDMAARAAHLVARNLSLGRGESFYAKPLSIAADREPRRPPVFEVSFPLGIYAPYDLNMIRHDIAAAEKVAQRRDAVMTKALVYYEHGLYLYETYQSAETGSQGIKDHVDFLTTHYALTLADCFLSWYKAITAVLGDPATSEGKKSYQERYKELGLSDEFFRSRVEALRRLRNDADVAHYSLERQGLEKIRNLLKTAKETTETVLRAYRDKLERGRSTQAA